MGYGLIHRLDICLDWMPPLVNSSVNESLSFASFDRSPASLALQLTQNYSTTTPKNSGGWNDCFNN
jgi:hypothetical protein